MTHRAGIEVEQADQDFADDARADGTEPIARLPDVGFAKDVVPERRLTAPASGRDANFLGGQRRLAQPTRDRLARRQPHALATLQVAHGEASGILRPRRFTGQRHRQRDQRARPAGRRSSWREPPAVARAASNSLRPIDPVSAATGRKPIRSGKDRHGAARARSADKCDGSARAHTDRRRRRTPAE